MNNSLIDLQIQKQKLIEKVLDITKAQQRVISYDLFEELEGLTDQKQKLIDNIINLENSFKDGAAKELNTVHSIELLKKIEAIESENINFLKIKMNETLNTIKTLEKGKKAFNAYNKNSLYG